MEKFWDMRKRLLPDITYRERPNGTFKYRCLCGFEYSGSPIIVEDAWINKYIKDHINGHKCMNPTGHKHKLLKGK